MTFETIYKTVIIMTDINDVLRELNALSLKENQNSIEKLMNMIEIDRTVIRSSSTIQKNDFELISSVFSDSELSRSLCACINFRIAEVKLNYFSIRLELFKQHSIFI